LSPELQSKIEAVIAALHGWCSVEKALQMATLILDTRPEVIVEIGVFGGRSLIPQALAAVEADRGIVYGIDPWKKEAALAGSNDIANDEWWSKVDLEAIHQSCMEAIWSRALDKRACVIRATSETAANLFGNQTIDVLYLDGNHSEECSVQDVQLWLPKVKPLGFIWFDDTDWQTTRRAFAMLKGKLNYIREIDRCALFHKSKVLTEGTRKSTVMPVS